MSLGFRPIASPRRSDDTEDMQCNSLGPDACDKSRRLLVLAVHRGASTVRLGAAIDVNGELDAALVNNPLDAPPARGLAQYKIGDACL